MRTRIRYFMAAALAAAAAGAAAQSRLPPCPGSFATAKWSNCYGEAVAPNGARYAGEWLNDQFHGLGTNTYLDGSKYAGEYRNNLRNGQGTFTYRDGATYTGAYKDGVRSGRGTFAYPNGARFVGEYLEDKRNGRGVEYDWDKSVLRSGTWENDAFTGGRQAPEIAK